MLIVAQAGRLEYQALILAASLRHSAPEWRGKLIVAEPLAAGAWAGHETAISAGVRDLLIELGAEITPFTAQYFGATYPYGNKIEALACLPAAEPFLFLDTDTLITGPIDRLVADFSRPSASMRRQGTWPEPPLYGPGHAEIWRALYDRFGLDFDASLDESYAGDDWRRYLYFNAGWFFGQDPARFGQMFLDWARAVRDAPGDTLACQSLDPWLDQIVLPLVVHALGGGRPGDDLAGLDGDLTCHYRNLPLLYASGSDAAIALMEEAIAPNRIKKVLRNWSPARRLIYQRKGRDKVRPIFGDLPATAQEKPIRKRLRAEGWWLV